MNCKYKSFMTKKKAFTLIELLIVIAIIGILFVVLVSKVDFATDKAKATGVQTDFRSFQLALDTVSKEKAGFNSFGWNTGDANANGVRDSVDEGDANEDGIYQDGETWTGHKKYLETWTDKYSLIRPGTTFEADGYDKDAIFALETAINKNLDPKLHITIDAKTGLITMANGAQDPWNTQYHGAYISAEDGMDRGAIVMYSNGANQKFGSEHDIANGVPTVIVPGNNKNGADDYSLVVCYTYTNGYGEVGNITTGFSNNQQFFTENNSYSDVPAVDDSNNITVTPKSSLDEYTWDEIQKLAMGGLSHETYINVYNINLLDKKDGYTLVDYDNYGGFCFMYYSSEKIKLNEENSNEGGYANLEVAEAVNNYKNFFDENLQNVLKEVTIICNDGKDWRTNEHHYVCKVFLPSAVEFGLWHLVDDDPYSETILKEGTVFDCFTYNFDEKFSNFPITDISTDMKIRMKISTGKSVWIRTAHPASNKAFYNTLVTGGIGNSYPTSSLATCPVFVVG